MLVAGGNDSFAQLAVPLRVTPHRAGLRIIASKVCVCVQKDIKEYHSSRFSSQGWGHILQILGAFWVES